MAVDPHALPAAGIATLGGVPLPLNPEMVAWKSVTKQAVTHTVGGKVVQVYGTAISEINVRGSYGTGGFPSAQAFLAQVQAWVSQQVGTLTAQQGQGIWNGAPLQFIFPFRGWSMPVYITKFFNPETNQSILVDKEIINYHWQLTLFNPNASAVVTAANPASDASMIQYINAMAQNFGWFPNQANGNTVNPGTNTDEYPQFDNLPNTLSATNGST